MKRKTWRFQLKASCWVLCWQTHLNHTDGTNLKARPPTPGLSLCTLQANTLRCPMSSPGPSLWSSRFVVMDPPPTHFLLTEGGNHFSEVDWSHYSHPQSELQGLGWGCITSPGAASSAAPTGTPDGQPSSGRPIRREKPDQTSRPSQRRAPSDGTSRIYDRRGSLHEWMNTLRTEEPWNQNAFEIFLKTNIWKNHEKNEGEEDPETSVQSKSWPWWFSIVTLLINVWDKFQTSRQNCISSVLEMCSSKPSALTPPPGSANRFLSTPPLRVKLVRRHLNFSTGEILNFLPSDRNPSK